MNLIITCARHLEPETEEELRDIGALNPTIIRFGNDLFGYSLL